MALVESLLKAIDYMEEHLLENITIEEIAKQANLSPSHFQRSFMILTGISVGEYLRRRRLTLAAQELCSTNSKILHENGTLNYLLQLNDGQIQGLLGIVDNYNEEKNTIDYWIAVEHGGHVPNDDFSSFAFPASKWAVFEVRGPIPTAIVNTWKQIYSEWFPSNGYEPAGIAPFEVYTESDPTKPDAYSEIWVPIK